MLTGQYPLDANLPVFEFLHQKVTGKTWKLTKFNSQLPKYCTDTIEAALQVDHTKRPKTGHDFYLMLKGEKPIPAIPSSGSKRFQDFWKSLEPTHKVAIVTGIIAGIVAIVTALIGILPSLLP